jgi:hypothetical protein
MYFKLRNHMYYQLSSNVLSFHRQPSGPKATIHAMKAAQCGPESRFVADNSALTIGFRTGTKQGAALTRGHEHEESRGECLSHSPTIAAGQQ